MQPCSREMQGLNSLFSNNHTQNQHQHQHQHQQQIQMNHQLDHLDPTSHDDFLKDMLSTLPPSSTSSSSWNLDPNQKPFWGDLNPPSNSDETAPSAVDNVVFPYDEHASLASKFRNHQISAASSPLTAKAAALMLQQQLLMSRGAAADSGILQMFDSSRNDVVDGSSSFKSPNPAGDGSVQALYNGFAGSLHGASLASNQTHHFQQPQGQGGSNPMQGQGQSFGGSGGGANQAPGGGNPGQPKQRVRARRGQATDPHSIAERLRRERIAERMKALQELVPNANKTDKASMLDEIIDYVKFLQLQVKVLSMSRLGGAAAVAPLVADITSEGGGSDCVQANANGGAHPRNSNGNQTTAASSSNDSLTMTEQQVAKLMEEDMGSAMQYLQGKGLCLMPISLATAISTATCHARNPLINNHPTPVIASNGDGPSSPGMSVLTVQSGTVGNGDAVKDAASISKP